MFAWDKDIQEIHEFCSEFSNVLIDKKKHT